MEGISGFSDRQTLPRVPQAHQSASESILVRLAVLPGSGQRMEMAEYFR
jgi:hypothetical protein